MQRNKGVEQGARGKPHGGMEEFSFGPVLYKYQISGSSKQCAFLQRSRSADMSNEKVSPLLVNHILGK